MANIPNLDYAPLKSWEDFESMMLELYQKKWNDSKAQKNGRKGQKQHGIDIWGHANGSKEYTGVQCKGKEQWPPHKLTFAQVKAEVGKAQLFEPSLSTYEIATTAKRDASLDTRVRKFNEQQALKHNLQVSIKYWEDILEDEALDESLARKYLGTQYDSTDIVAQSNEDGIAQRIGYARKLVETYKVDTAYDQLQEIKAKEWTGLSDKLKFKLLSNLGRACALRHEIEAAADYFIEAYALLPNEETGVTNRAWAHIQRSEYAEVRSLLEPFIVSHPTNELAYSNYITASDDKNLEQLLQFIPKHMQAKPLIASSLGLVAHIEGRLDDAEKFYQEAIAAADESLAIDSKLGLASVLNDKAFLVKDVLGLRQVNKATQELIRRSVELVVDWWNVIGGTELGRYNTDQALRLAHQLRLVDKIEDAKRVAYRVLGFAPNNSAANLLLGIFAADRNELNDAVAFFEAAASTGSIDAKMLLVQVQSKQGESQKVIDSLIALKPELEEDELKRQAMDILSSEYIRTQQYTAATEEIDEFLVTHPDDVSAEIQKAAIILLTEGEEKAVTALKALAKDFDSTNRDEQLELADALYGARLYQEASNLYEKILDTTVITDWVRKLLDCHYRLGKFADVLKISAELRKQNGPIPFVTELESYIYEDIGDLQKAKDACEELLKRFPDNKGIQLRLAAIHFKLNDLTSADALLAKFGDSTGLTLNDTFALVGLLYERGFRDSARAILYQARRDNPDNKEVHSKYIAFFLITDKEYDELEVNVVGKDTAVSVEGSFGQTTYLLHDGPTNFESKEFNLRDDVAKALLGKKIGDEVDLSPGGDKVKITGIRHKYIYALLKSQELYQSTIFQNQDLKQFTFDPSKPEDVFKEINKNVTERRRAVVTIENLYRDRKLTLGAFANLIGKTTYEVFKELQHRELSNTIFVSNGNVIELEAAEKLDIKGQLIVDETSLVTIRELGVEDLVVQNYGKLGIARATLDALQEHARRTRETRKDGFKNLTSANGKILVDNITPEAVEMYLEELDTLLNFIDTSCEVLPVDKALELDHQRVDEFRRTLSDGSAMTILLAAGKDRTLFTEDGLLRAVAQSEFQTPGVWVQPILLQLKSKGAIDQDQYSRLLIDLIKRNHSHTHFELSTLEFAAKESDWKLAGPLKSLLRVFSEASLDRLSIIGIATNFLYAIWKHATLNARDRELVAKEIITRLLQRPDKDKVLVELNKAIEIKFKLWPSAAKDIKNIISQLSP